MESNLSIQNKKSLLSNNMNVEIIITKYVREKTKDWEKIIEHIDENDWIKEIYIRKVLKCIFDSSYIDMCFPDPMVLSHISFEARNKCHCHFAPLPNQTFVITDFDNCVYLNQILELYVEHVSKLCTRKSYIR